MTTTITEAGREGSRRGQAASAALRTARTETAIMEFLRRRAVTGAQADHIAAAADRSRSQTIRRLTGLINAGLVERFVDPHDGRARRYRPTPAGQAR